MGVRVGLPFGCPPRFVFSDAEASGHSAKADPLAITHVDSAHRRALYVCLARGGAAARPKNDAVLGLAPHYQRLLEDLSQLADRYFHIFNVRIPHRIRAREQRFLYLWLPIWRILFIGRSLRSWPNPSERQLQSVRALHGGMHIQRPRS